MKKARQSPPAGKGPRQSKYSISPRGFAEHSAMRALKGFWGINFDIFFSPAFNNFRYWNIPPYILFFCLKESEENLTYNKNKGFYKMIKIIRYKGIRNDKESKPYIKYYVRYFFEINGERSNVYYSKQALKKGCEIALRKALEKEEIVEVSIFSTPPTGINTTKTFRAGYDSPELFWL